MEGGALESPVLGLTAPTSSLHGLWTIASGGWVTVASASSAQPHEYSSASPPQGLSVVCLVGHSLRLGR